ncbi:MAG: DUF4982 domain-containing protein [Lachnospiraceae bacterium]|nr:DUF4982 domain-containing protein [Lachnospiraceae bacterium]
MLKLYNNDWRFLKTSLGVEKEEIEGRRDEFQPVDIPHDWMIYDTHNLYEDSIGWYLKTLDKDALALTEGERVYIRFDGVYMDSTFYVNGQKVGDWKYGYSTFGFDITEYLHEGENVLLMQVRHQSPNSRWYSGAGIYRNVWLKVYPKMYLPLDGTYVCSEAIEEGKYRIEIDTEVAGAISEATTVQYTLLKALEAEGETSGSSVWKEVLAQLGTHQSVSEKEDCKVYSLTTTVSDVKEWDIEEPNCYTLRVELLEDGCVLDRQEITVGFRRVAFDTNEGFFLNGRHVKLYGVCEHHDLGCLGAAFHKEAMRRKFKVLRGAGINALRTSHNMPAPEVMELADEMGFLVVSEGFDMWERPKTEYDYGRFFKEWAGRDVRSWVRRDRNHPSLIMWSIGNEIYDTHADAWAPDITRRLQGYVLEHDYKQNAPVTIGSNYMPWEGAQRCTDILKMAGYNYGEKCYEEHHKEHPDWVIYGSETASVVQSRGVYRFPLSQSMLADEDEQCSALGNSCTSWGAKNIEACIIDDRDATFSCGQFLWTGFDYIGEPTPYQTKNSYFGHVDTSGFPKDSYYVLEAEWTDVKKNPMVHLYPYWDFNEGMQVDVRACTNGESVELFVNGESQGRQYIDHAHGKVLQGHWQVAYTPGEIAAVAYDENGAEIARDSRHSFGDGVQLVLEADKEVIKANGEDLCFVSISAIDKDGYLVDNAMDYVEVLVEGAARLVGMDNGDSTDYDAYKGNVRKLFNGKLLAVLAAKTQAGDIKVTVKSKSLADAELILQAVEAPVREGISCEEDLMKQPMMLPDNIPVRKVEINTKEGTLLNAQKQSALVEATIYPAMATDKEIIWKVVNGQGIEITFAKVEVVAQEGNTQVAKITAIGDGDFLVRCMSKSGTDKVEIISQVSFKAEGLGQASMDPYSFLSAGLYTDTIGTIGNGNEQGAAMDNGPSAIIFEKLDFGDYGSDEITVPIFAVDGKPYAVEIWLGRPDEADSEKLLDTIYQKPSIWAVYQPDTWKLAKRIKGLATISIKMYDKVHIKGFSFTRFEKAFSKVDAIECSNIYGDSFTKEEKAITGIGNNVSIEYDNMDFGEQGASEVTIWSRSPLAGNTIHIIFTAENGESMRRVVEVKGTSDYKAQTLCIEPICGKGKVEFVFLPGSDFDMEAFQFQS